MGSAAVEWRGVQLITGSKLVVTWVLRGGVGRLSSAMLDSTVQCSTKTGRSKQASSNKGEGKLNRLVNIYQHLHDWRLRMQTTPSIDQSINQQCLSSVSGHSSTQPPSHPHHQYTQPAAVAGYK